MRVIYFLIFMVPFTVADRVVMTSTGPVQGITVSKGDPTVEAFLGVPYAEPPLGDLRFRRPVPKRPWSGVYRAFRQPPSCMQNASTRYFEPNLEGMTEDCLFLSLWVPYTKQTTQLKPIILFIHGGAFTFGSSNMQLYDGTNMARFGDVIMANMNYRVGPFGFFLAYIEEAQGNMGMFDQILAIKWVKDNAKAFGGDPDNIVLMGESAGAAATGAHLMSPLSKNLFKRAIMLSGSPVMVTSLDNNTVLFQSSQQLSFFSGCTNKTMTLQDHPREVVECLKSVPAQVLVDAEGILRKTKPMTFLPRTFVDYFPEPPVHLLKKGAFLDTELLIGTDLSEGSLFLTAAAPEYFGYYGMNRISRISKRLATQLMRLTMMVMGIEDTKEVSDYYLGKIQHGSVDAFVDTISDAVGDYYITCNTYYQAEFHSLRNPVYYYMMSLRPSSTPLAEWMKTTHFDELQYIFGNPLFQNFTAKEKVFSKRVMARWVAFAKTGNPNVPGLVEWPKFTREEQKYLDLNDEETVRSRPDHNRCEFWRDRHQAVFTDEIISRIKGYANGGVATATNVLQTVAWVMSTILAFRNI